MEQITYFKDEQQKAIDKWICDIGNGVKNFKDFENYAKQNEDTEWLNSDALQRLFQSVVNFTPERQNILISNLYGLFAYIIENFKIVENEIFSKLIRMCDNLIKLNEKQWIVKNWIKHRNVCLSFGIVLNLCKPNIERQTIDQMFDYLIRIIHKQQHMECVLWAVLVLEKLHEYTQFSNDKIAQMVQFEELFNLNETLTFCNIEFDCFFYQVKYCLRIFIDHLLKGDENIQSVKISNDGVSVRCDDSVVLSFIRSSFKVTSKVFFYEVYLLTEGLSKIGWATEDCDVEMPENSKNSIFLDVGQKLIVHGTNKHKIDSNISFEPGVTVGFLIDFLSKKFEFYVDGGKLDFSGNVNFSSDPYYASALFSTHQHIYFNFGQKPFKYPPKNKSSNFFYFHLRSGNNMDTYRLMVHDILYFKREFNYENAAIEIIDKKQEKIDKMVRNIENNFSNSRQWQWIYKNDFAELITGQQDFICLIKSIIKYVGTQIKNNKIDAFIGHITEYLSVSNPPASHWVDVLEIISPIMKLNQITFKNQQKQQNVCIVLMIVFQRSNIENKELLFDKVKDFLWKKLANESANSWTMFFVVKCVEYNLRNLTYKTLEIIETLCNLANYIESRRDYSNLSNVDLIHYQVSFCAKNIIESIPIFSLISQIQNHNLNVAYEATSKLQISNQSVRSDDNWQSIKFNFNATHSTYFYEVTLLTSGSMRFGWAPIDTEFDRINSDDKYSIEFDGYRQCIRQNKAAYKIDWDYRWQAGTVLGCVVDAQNKTFLWYLNGEPVECKKGLFGIKHKWNFSSSQYQPTASLSSLQQCVFNFGQYQFRYPPFILYSCFQSQNSTTMENLEEFEEQCFQNQIDFNEDKQKLFDKLIMTILNGELTTDLMENYLQANKVITDWFGVEEILRATFSIIKVIDKNCVNFYHIYWFFNKITLRKTDIIMKNLLKWRENCQRKMLLTSLNKRIICMIFVFILEKADISIKCETCNKTFVFLTNIIQEKSQNFETAFWAMVALEKLFIVKWKTINQHFKTNIVKLTANLREQFKTLEILSIYDICQNPDQYRNAFCAKWLCEQLVSQTGSIPPVKLSVDKLTAGNDAWPFPTVMSVFPVYSGVYFYEAVHVCGGIMQIGWSTKDSHFSETNGVGDDQHSIGFDGFRNYIWHNGQIGIKKWYHWKAGDVVGCLINANKKEFRFYLNGKLIDEYEVKVYFSSKPYYAAASISSHQQCVFNFGSEPFKHAPGDIKYKNIHLECHGNICLYKLQAPTLINDRFVFEETSSYNDDKQIKLNELLDLNSFKFNFDKKKNEREIQEYVRDYIDSSEVISRLFQIIINFSGKIHNEKFQTISDIFNHLRETTFEWSLKSSLQFELLPMLNTLTNADNLNVHRNVIIFLTIQCEIINRKRLKIEDLIPLTESCDYLVNIIDKSDDQETTLRAMLLWEKLHLKNSNYKFGDSQKFVILLNKLKQLSSGIENQIFT